MNFSVLAGRSFRLLEYRAQHGELRFRSSDSGLVSSDIDVIFGGVQYFSVPLNIGKIVFASATEDDVAHVFEVLGGGVKSCEIYVLTARCKRYVIVADYITIEERSV